MKKLFNPSRIISFGSALLVIGLGVVFLPGCKPDKKNLVVESKGFLSAKIHYYQHFFGTDTANNVMVGAGCTFIDVAGTTINVGGVSLNQMPLDVSDVVGEYYYGLSNQAENFFNTTTSWYISGSEKVKGFTYDNGHITPFRMDLPYSLVKANGINFSINIPPSFSYTEVIVTIGDKDDNRISRTFTDGNISISPATFNNLSIIDGNSYIMVEVLSKKVELVNKQEVTFSSSVIEQHPIDIQ
jgi:hypothetical protein